MRIVFQRSRARRNPELQRSLRGPLLHVLTLALRSNRHAHPITRDARTARASQRRKGDSDKPNAPCGLVLCNAPQRSTPRRADPRLTPAVPHPAKANQGAGTLPDHVGQRPQCNPCLSDHHRLSPQPTARTETRPPQRSVTWQTVRPSSPASSISPRKPAERQQAGRDPVKAPRPSRPVTAFQRVFRRAGEIAAHATRARRPPRRYGTIQGPHGWPWALWQELSMPKGRTPFPVRFRSGTLTAGRLSRTGTR